jgi:hypothetical protein
VPGTESGAVRFQYRYSQGTLPITAQAFAALCSELDLGQGYQEHLASVFEAPATADGVRGKMIRAHQDEMTVAVHIARMRSEISGSAHAALLALVAGDSAPLLDGKPVQCSQLKLFGCALNEVLLIGPQREGSDRSERCVAYIPGAPLYPLKEYASTAAFMQELRANLLSPTYRKFFARFVAHPVQGAFFSALARQLFIKQWDADGLLAEVANPDARLVVQEFPIEGELFHALHEQQVAWLKAQARALAVPTADADYAARLERLAYWLEEGINVLNVVAMFVPALNGVMLAVTGAQLMTSIFHGVEAWEAGDTAAAVAQLESLALNIAFIAALGAAAAASEAPKVAMSTFVDGMLPVKLPNGQTRLWKPDITPYATDLALPDGIKPNTLGQYEVEGRYYLRLNGKLYEHVYDSALKQWRIVHPTDPATYQPILQHNQVGAWRYSAERPLEWDTPTLLRRIGHSVDSFSDKTLEQIRQASGVNADVLRRMHVEHEPPPPLLAETISRFRIEQDIDRLILQIRAGEPADETMIAALPLMVRLPAWPEGRVLQVFEGAEPWGRFTEYGAEHSPNGYRIKITRAQVLYGELSVTVLDTLDETQLSALLGDGISSDKSVRAQSLRDRLADGMSTRKAQMHDVVYTMTQTSADPQVALLQGDFPRLPKGIAKRLIDQADDLERARLQDHHRVPLRLAEEARWYLREMTLSRAIEGLYLEGLPSADSDRLALHFLQRLPGWPNDLCLQMRTASVNGQLLGRVGKETAAIRRTLVKEGPSAYRAYDDNGNSLNGLPKQGNTVFDAILAALPDASRKALGMNVYDAQVLRNAVAGRAVQDRNQAAMVLGLRPIKPWFQPPMRLPGNRLGYPLSGRGSAGANTRVGKVRDLYPGFDDEEAAGLLESWGLEAETQLARRRDEFEGLNRTLDEWASTGGLQPVSAEHVLVVAEPSRRQIALMLKRCWQRTTPKVYALDGRFVGYQLDLSSHVVGDLPALTADFSHVAELLMANMELWEEPNAFLRHFPTLRWLNLRSNRLPRLPEAIGDMGGLTKLFLEGNQITLGPQEGVRLAGLSNLKMLRLDNNPLQAPPDVGQMTHLRGLTLRHTGIDRWPPGLTELTGVEHIDLRHNRITEIPDAVLNPSTDRADAMTRMNDGTYLHDNPLSVESAQRLADYRERTGISLGVIERPMRIHARRGAVTTIEAQCPAWLQGEPPAQITLKTRQWEALQAESDSEGFFTLLEDLRVSADYQHNYTELKGSVWAMIDAASQSTELRGELFRMAAHGRTCSDGVTLVFSELKIRVLVHQALLAAGDGQAEAQLLKLARGLYRLDEVEKIAQQDIAARIQAINDDPQLSPVQRDARIERIDQVEVRLAYRVGLRATLELPGQARNASFLGIAGVTPQMLTTAQEQVLQLEAGPGLLASILQRDYWVEFLKQKYADRFEQVNEPYFKRLTALDADKDTMTDGRYKEQVELISSRRRVEEDKLINELTQQALGNEVEITEL